MKAYEQNINSLAKKMTTAERVFFKVLWFYLP